MTSWRQPCSNMGWVCTSCRMLAVIIDLLPWMKSVVLGFFFFFLKNFAKIRTTRREIAWFAIKLNVTVNGNNCVNAWLFVEFVMGNAYFCAETSISVCFKLSCVSEWVIHAGLIYFYRLWPGPLKPANTEKMASPFFFKRAFSLADFNYLFWRCFWPV